MIDNLYKIKLTKNAVALYQLIEQKENFNLSLTEIAKEMKISKTTVLKSINSLLDLNLIKKSYYFVGQVLRCAYTSTTIQP